MTFYKDLVEIEEKLKSKGLRVNIPVSAQIMKERNNFGVLDFKEAVTPKQKGKYILQNFNKIVEGDSILVINNEKNGVKGYIGANVLMEIGLAFYFKKKIYILKPIEENAPYKEELLSFDVKFINNDLNKIV